jgi:hypothetical protein
MKSNVFCPMSKAWAARNWLLFVKLDDSRSCYQAKVSQSETVQQMGHPWRQRAEDIPKISARIQFSRLQSSVNAGPFLQQQRGNQGQRQDHYHEDDQH